MNPVSVFEQNVKQIAQDLAGGLISLQTARSKCINESTKLRNSGHYVGPNGDRELNNAKYNNNAREIDEWRMGVVDCMSKGI